MAPNTPKKLNQAITEAVKGMLNDSTLGLGSSKDETSHTSQFRWEGIDDAYALKVSDSPFFESITSAFFQVHSYKYIDHPTFKLSLESELRNRALPTEEIDRAMGAVDSLVEELSKTKPTERDAGWNPNIAEIADMTRNADNRKLDRPEPFTGGGPWPKNESRKKENLIPRTIEESFTKKQLKDPKVKTLLASYKLIESKKSGDKRLFIESLARNAKEQGFYKFYCFLKNM